MDVHRVQNSGSWPLVTGSHSPSWGPIRISKTVSLGNLVHSMVCSENGALQGFRLICPQRRSLLNRWVVATASVIMMVGLGFFNAWSVFRQPLSEFYDANVTVINTAFFVSSLVFGLVASGSALLVSRVGPRLVGVTGANLYGLGIFLGSFADRSIFFLYITYGLVAAVGLGLGHCASTAKVRTSLAESDGRRPAFLGVGGWVSCHHSSTRT